VESFNNAVLPYQGLDPCSLDFYLVAAPGVVLLYPGERLCQAMKVLGGVGRVDRLLPALSRPLLEEPLPPAQYPQELAEKLRGSRLAAALLPG
jgi:hypothetical protein